MIKPILKIEVPNQLTMEQFDKANEMLNLNTELKNEYHIVFIYGMTTDYTSVEIITASDISIHKPEN
jgi:hypothetical protein